MARDFRAALARDRCWDAHTERIYDRTGVPLDDCILQNREDLLAFCGFIEREQIRSYLEIGIWTGRLVSTLHRLFDFERVAACDNGAVLELGLPQYVPFGCAFFRGDSQSAECVAWRRSLGPIDLVLIDGDHSYQGVKRDFEIQRRFPHRWLAFHDVLGLDVHTVGVRRFWDELEGEGEKIVIAEPHLEDGRATPTMGLGLWRAGDRGR